MKGGFHAWAMSASVVLMIFTVVFVVLSVIMLCAVCGKYLIWMGVGFAFFILLTAALRYTLFRDRTDIIERDGDGIPIINISTSTLKEDEL